MATNYVATSNGTTVASGADPAVVIRATMALGLDVQSFQNSVTPTGKVITMICIPSPRVVSIVSHG